MKAAAATPKPQRFDLYGELRNTIINYVKQQGCYNSNGVRDALTDLRHLADAWGLDFAAIDRSAFAVYLEESPDRAPKHTGEPS